MVEGGRGVDASNRDGGRRDKPREEKGKEEKRVSKDDKEEKRVGKEEKDIHREERHKDEKRGEKRSREDKDERASHKEGRGNRDERGSDGKKEDRERGPRDDRRGSGDGQREEKSERRNEREPGRERLKMSDETGGSVNNLNNSNNNINSPSKRPKTDQTPSHDPLPKDAPKWIPESVSLAQVIAVMRMRIDELTRKLESGQFEKDDYDRAQSAEPVYDNFGKQVDLRDMRVRESLTREREALIEEALKIDTAYKPPADYRPESRKYSKKVHIPMKEFPEYNFIGLIIGPRGNTQKRMERETGAKISIRGKSSQNSKPGRPDGDDEQLHVLITADNRDSMEKAAKMVEQLLVPLDEKQNEHKRKQLRELAVINGVPPGTRPAVAPPPPPAEPVSAVMCRICGERTHPTPECPKRGKNIEKKAAMESDYHAFLAEIGEADRPPPPPPGPASVFPPRPPYMSPPIPPSIPPPRPLSIPPLRSPPPLSIPPLLRSPPPSIPPPPQSRASSLEDPYNQFMAEIEGAAPPPRKKPLSEVEKGYESFMAEIEGVGNKVPPGPPPQRPFPFPPPHLWGRQPPPGWVPPPVHGMEREETR